MSKNVMWVIAVIVIGLGLWYLLGSGTNTALGRVVFTMKDNAVDMKGVTSILLTVDKVEVHSAVSGWTTVSTTSKQYDLVKLKQTGAAELMADIKLAAGTYDQIRLDISHVTVTASGKTQDAKLPSNMLKIVGTITVTADQTAVVTLDFMADKSLHLTGSGKYILAPVVRLTHTSDAEVDVKDEEKVTVSGGEVDEDETVGMDEKGEVKADFELNDKAGLEIDASGAIHLGR